MILLSKLINRCLAQDSETAQRLSAYKGKIVQLELLPLRRSFFMHIHENSIALSTQSQAAPHVVIRGTPLNLLGMDLKAIEITGDILLLQDLSHIFTALDIGLMNKMPYAVKQLLDGLKNFSRQVQKSLSRNLTEYLQEECRCLVPRAELEDFCEAVDNLRDAQSRLEAKIKMLETAL